ncbi:sensor histidine kinase [Marinicrinis lubricantis]|uniref:histidine kinase n=1 Tax=Marinicrinis lubricantis TaxID=2086470 RepID=A0ABW1IU25_9BACL
MGLAIDLFLFGCLFIMGLYHLSLFAYRRQEKSVLYFGLFCLLQAMRTLIVSQSYLLQLFPQMDWTFTLKLEYETFYLALPIAAGFIYHLFPQDMSKKALRVSQGLGLLFGMLTILTPTYELSRMNWLYQWITVITAVYLFTVSFKAVVRKREDAPMIAIGALCYGFTVIIDILYYNEWIFKGDFASFGLLIGVFSQSFILARRFSKAFRHVEVMTERLQQLNVELEQKVAMRTADLNKMEHARRQLLSDVSHDLKTPITLIQGYVEALAAGMVEELQQQRKYLNVILTRVQGLNRLIKDLFELSKLEAGQIAFDFISMPASQFIDYFSDRYELEVTGAGKRYEVQRPLDLANSLTDKAYVRVDLHKMDQLFTNLIHNGIQYNDSADGVIRLVFRMVTDPFGSEGMLLIPVEDNGPGIDPEDAPKIFDRFYKSDKTRNTSVGGSGLGLAIVKEIATRHGGEVGVKSTLSKGSTFYVRLPIYWEDM